MDYSAVIETGAGRKPEKVSSDRITTENGKKETGLSGVKKGQLITGTVVSVEDQVTLDFDGQKVTASKTVLSDAVPGEIKTFEVVKATDREIELKLTDGNAGNRPAFKAALIKDGDWESVLAQKNQAAKKAGKEAQVKEITDKLEEISSRLTEKDCRLLEEEGFSVETFPVKGLYEAIGRMKSAAPQENKNLSDKTDREDKINKTDKTGKAEKTDKVEKTDSADKAAVPSESKAVFDEKALADRLKAENLPATKDNLSKISKALGLSETAAKMDDKAMQYLISRNAPPTPENIYKACYSGTKQTQKLTEDAWQELEGQVKEVIKSAGYEVNKENMESAKWLIENKLPLTEETFAYKKDLEDIKSNYSKGAALDELLEGMKNGISPEDVSLRKQEGASGEKIITDIRSIKPEAITEAVQTGTELTIRNLAAIQESLDAGGNGSSGSGWGNGKAADTTSLPAAGDTEAVKDKTQSGKEINGEVINDKAASDNEINGKAFNNKNVNDKGIQEKETSDQEVNGRVIDDKDLSGKAVNDTAAKDSPVSGKTDTKRSNSDISDLRNTASLDYTTRYNAPKGTDAGKVTAEKPDKGNAGIENIRNNGAYTDNIKAEPSASRTLDLQNMGRQNTDGQSIDNQSIDKENSAKENSAKATSVKAASVEETSVKETPVKESSDTETTDTDIAGTKLSGSNSKPSDNENQGSGNPESGSGNQDNRYEEVRARRQLEEIRLKMTLEAANLLEKKGFKIETRELSKVVDALKDLEDSYYKGFFKEADTEVTNASLQTLKDTTQSIEQLKYMPSYLLGSTLAERNTLTIPGLLSEGSKLQAELAKAGTAYETLMTVPNREYGDSIQKAFGNMSSLLSELKLENTEQNQRAVRILGYNRMEINEENINQVKAYDLQVTTLIRNLHPAVTVRMIKEGYNPLDMPVNELNDTIDRIKEEQGITSEDKYSTYLSKLEREDGITAEERKAYIGIYRLLYNIEKSDGAALGAVVKANREVTLDNLLTAVQTGKKGKLDAVINDEFGTLQSISREKESITEQLEPFTGSAGRQKEGRAEEPDSKEDKAEEIQYIDRILKQLKEEISPGKLNELEKSLNRTGQEQNQPGRNGSQADTAAAQPAGTSSMQPLQKGIWEMIKDVPAEKLLGQLRNTDEEPIAGDKAYADKVQEIRELCKNSEQAVRFLNDYQVPSTPMSIMIANHILSNGESPVKRLFQLKKENIVEKSENSLKEMNDLSDTLIDKHSMEEAYGQLETDAKAALAQSFSEEKIDNRKLAELKTLGQQMTFIRKLAEKEYYQIPIETDGGVTNMNLTILRGTQSSGKVSVTVWSEQLGNVKAEFTLKDKTLKGFISSDSRSGLEQLQKNAGELETAADESSVTLKQLDFGVQRRDNNTYSYQNPGSGESGSSQSPETERTLYRIAKAIVRTVRSAENNATELNRAVS